MLSGVAFEIEDSDIAICDQKVPEMKPPVEASAHRVDPLLKDRLELEQYGRLMIEHLGRQRPYIRSHLRQALANEFDPPGCQTDIAVIQTLPIEIVKGFGRKSRIRRRPG